VSVPLPTGWSPGRNEGESEAEAAARLLVEYPGTTGVRKFFGTSTINSGAGALGVLPNHAGMRVSISFEQLTVPVNLRGEVIELVQRGFEVDVIGYHEFEKKVTPTQLLSVYRQLDTMFPRSDPLRAAGTVQLVVVATVQRARVYAPDDLRRFITPDLAQLVDIIGWDWYPSYAKKSDIDHYEDPAEAFALMLSFGDEVGVPAWGLYEENHERITEANGFAVNLDPSGVMCADWMLRSYRWAVQNRCVRWLHFHTSGGRLTAPGNVRAPEYNALLEMIAMSGPVTEPVPGPDPVHPQYVYGYDAGLAVGTDAGRAAGLSEGRIEGARSFADGVTAYVADQRP